MSGTYIQVFNATCRGCNREIEQEIKCDSGEGPKNSVRIRCAKCRETNYATPKKNYE